MEQAVATDLKLARLVVHKLNQTFDSFQSHAFSIAALSEQWQNLQSSFAKVEATLSSRVKELDYKDRGLVATALRIENLQKEVQLKERSLVERLKEVELREKEIKDFYEGMEMEKKRIRSHCEALKAKEKKIFEGLNRVRVIEEELKGKEIEIDAHFKDLELKEIDMCAQVKDLELKEMEIGAHVKDLKLKEMEIGARVKDLKLKEMEIGAHVKDLELKEMEIGAHVKDLELKEMEIGVRVKDLELKEMEIGTRVKDLELNDEVLKERLLNEYSEVFLVMQRDLEDRLEKLKMRGDDMIARFDVCCKEIEDEHGEKKAVIDERLKDLELKEMEIDVWFKDLELKENVLKERVMDEHRQVFLAMESDLRDRLEKLKVRGDEMIARFNVRCKEVEVEHEEKKAVIDERLKDLELKEKELGEVLVLKEKEMEELNVQEFIEQLESRRKELEVEEEQQKAVIDALSLKEDQMEEDCKALEAKEVKICERLKLLESEEKVKIMNCRKIELKARKMKEQLNEFETKEKQINESLGNLELKEKNLKDDLQALELKEKQLDKHGKEMQLKEKEMKELGEAIEKKEKQIFRRGKVQELIAKDLELSKEENDQLRRRLETSEEEDKKLRGALELKEKEIDDLRHSLELMRNQIGHCERMMELKEREINERSRRLELMEEEDNQRRPALELKEKEVSERIQHLKPMANQELNMKTKAQESKEKPNDEYCKGLEQNSNESNKSGNYQCVKVRSLCINMNANGLGSYLNDHVKDHNVLRGDILSALRCAPDPAKLVLNVCQGFHETDSKKRARNDNRSSCIYVLELLMMLNPNITPSIRTKARRFGYFWMGRLKKNNSSPADAFGFLQFLAAYKLAGFFKVEDMLLHLTKLYSLENPYLPEKHVSLCNVLEISDNIPGTIKSLIENNKRLDAIKFICVFKMEDSFPLEPLLKDHVEYVIQTGKERRRTKNWQAKVKASNKEYNGLVAVLKCMSEFKLMSQFKFEHIMQRIEQLRREREINNNSSKSTKKKNAESQITQRFASSVNEMAESNSFIKESSVPIFPTNVVRESETRKKRNASSALSVTSPEFPEKRPRVQIPNQPARQTPWPNHGPMTYGHPPQLKPDVCWTGPHGPFLPFNGLHPHFAVPNGNFVVAPHLSTSQFVAPIPYPVGNLAHRGRGREWEQSNMQ